MAKDAIPISNGESLGSGLDKENDRRRQLPTPSLSPVLGSPLLGNEDDDLEKASISSFGVDGAVAVNGNGSVNTSTNGSRRTSTSTSSRRPSVTVTDEPILSDGATPRPKPKPQTKRPVNNRRRSSAGLSDRDPLLKLSPKQVFDFASEPLNLPVRTASPILEDTGSEAGPEYQGEHGRQKEGGYIANGEDDRKGRSPTKASSGPTIGQVLKIEKEPIPSKTPSSELKSARPGLSSSRAFSTPLIRRKTSSQKTPGHGFEGEAEHSSRRAAPPSLNLDRLEGPGPSPLKPSALTDRDPSPIPPSLPLPPMSIPTFLALELSSDRPSPLYLYRSPSADFPYESSQVKFERLLNFLFLPPQLERILGFGTLACLDAWLYVLTILPLRFLISVWILGKFWIGLVVKEIKDLCSYVYWGLGRLWQRRKGNLESVPPTPADEDPPNLPGRQTTFGAPMPNSATSAKENGKMFPMVPESKRPRSSRYRHRRTKSTPSTLEPNHKADLLKGLLVISTCWILMRFDASRMYHGIRGQAAIKLYVIYNVLEVCDRLFSALGQDILECLLSRETLDRNPDGRSKVIRPFWMFMLALIYNVIHATALFYQVVTLNVAVNSFSNALLTLLMSNQFVEIKGTVFKRFEKENLFQITCADIVERFQLWLMLLIIAMRNIVEVGGLSIHGGESIGSSTVRANTTGPAAAVASILPFNANMLPKWTGQILGPFFVVLGSEMLVDWLKHAYITKFNVTKPEIYGKFYDVLAKDYYNNAFVEQNLTKRLGLPVLPLACLFIRATVQTYHMFIATHMPTPLPSPITSLTTESTVTSSPTTAAALAHIDQLFRRALGRSAFPSGGPSLSNFWSWWQGMTFDDLGASAMMISIFLGAYLFLLAFKLLLGMLLLRAARDRYKSMKERERLVTDTGGKRFGGWGVVEVDDDKRRWIYADDAEGLKAIRKREERARKEVDKERKGEVDYARVMRYDMVAKRIW